MAHVGTSRVDDEVGEALDDANLRRRSSGTGDEDDDAPVDWGLLWSRASVCSSMGSGRSSGVWRGSEGVAVAARELVGDGGSVRSRRERGSRGERVEGGRVSETVSGIGTACGSRPRGQGLVGKQEVAARPCACEHAAASGEGRKTTEGCSGGLGRLLLGHQVGGPQVSVG